MIEWLVVGGALLISFAMAGAAIWFIIIPDFRYLWQVFTGRNPPPPWHR